MLFSTPGKEFLFFVPMAFYLRSLGQPILRPEVAFRASGLPIDDGAIDDLSPRSKRLFEINLFPSSLLMHNIVGIASQLQKGVNVSADLLDVAQSPLVCGKILPPDGFDALFKGDDSDLVVSATSQRAGIGPTSPGVSNLEPLIHTRAGGLFSVVDGAAELESEGVSREVIDLLNLSLDAPEFIRLSP